MAVAAEIILTADEKKRLEKSIRGRKTAVRLQARSGIVLLASEGMTKARIRGALERLRGRVKAALTGEDFRQKLVQQHQGETLEPASSHKNKKT